MPTDIEIEQKLETVYENKITLSAYLSRIKRLRDDTVKCNSYTELVSQPEENYEKIRDRYPNVSTRKNMLTTILSLFKNIDEFKTLSTQQIQWKKFHENMDSFEKAKYKKHMPNMDQLQKYTRYEDIETKYKEMEKGDPHKTIKDSLQFILLSIIISTPPKRSDYGELKIYYDVDPNDTTSNYIVIKHSSPSYMVFNNYKTSKKHKRIDQDLSLQTTNDIKNSIRRHPRDFLFVNRFGNPFITDDGFSKYFINTFNILFGRKTGSTILRHIFVTEKISFDDMDDDELESIAKQMMHTTTLQKKYNWNRKKICASLVEMCPECKK